VFIDARYEHVHELGRVVSIFPNDNSLSNLMGAVLEKTYYQPKKLSSLIEEA
jgi:hypothetical protein